MLRGVFLYSFCVLIFCGTLSSQTRVIKPKKTYPKRTNFSVGAGLTRSVLFLTRNVKEDNNATGYSFYITYGGAKIVRTTLEYTYYRPINIEPTWYNIQASTLETNAHIMARFKHTKAYFYPLVGLSYNQFSGYFTGRNDFLGLSQKHSANTTVVTNWLGLNVGTGYEQFIGKASFFIDYKMRVGYNDGGSGQLNIMDVCLGFGARYNIKVPSVYKIFSGTKNRYFLDAD